MQFRSELRTSIIIVAGCLALLFAGQSSAEARPNKIWIPVVNRGEGEGSDHTDGEQSPTQGIFISPQEIAALPTMGPAWENLQEWAEKDVSSPDLSDQNDQTDAAVLARALIYVRTGEEGVREEVVDAIMKAIGTEDGGRTLALGRNLAAYIIAADLVGLDATDDARFRDWLDAVRYEELDGRTLITTHEERPNNWGTHAGVPRIAAALYLNDEAELERAARVFQGWTGVREAYGDFEYDEDLSWHCDPLRPVPVNPTCNIEGHPAGGVLPDDQRRGGPFSWPAPHENYVWEALQGATAQAYLLERAGYPAFSWGDQALLRSARWLHDVSDFPADGDDTGTPWLLNSVYGTAFPAESPARPGKNGLGFYDWITAP